jgi:hypothetical protein
VGSRLEHESSERASHNGGAFMSWPMDEDGAPITYVDDGGRVYEGRAAYIASNVWRGVEHGNMLRAPGGGTALTEENLGVVWARGWGTKEAQALRTTVALSS